MKTEKHMKTEDKIIVHTHRTVLYLLSAKPSTNFQLSVEKSIVIIAEKTTDGSAIRDMN